MPDAPTPPPLDDDRELASDGADVVDGVAEVTQDPNATDEELSK
jgi:hypothetical protein